MSHFTMVRKSSLFGRKIFFSHFMFIVVIALLLSDLSQARPKSRTRACSNDDECELGLDCRSNICSKRCSENTDCNDHEVCAANSCSQPCFGDIDCNLGEVCAENICS